MAYTLWLKNSWRHHRRSYPAVLAVFCCAVFALAFFSAYADSVAYGEQIAAEAYTRGAHVVVRGGEAADLDRFAALEGVEAWFEDGDILLRVEDLRQLDAVSDAVNRIIRASGRALSALTYEASVRDAVYAGGGIATLKLVFSGIALIAIAYMLRVFLARRQADIATLLSLGAEVRRVALMLALEVGFLLAVALAVAIPTAGAVMRWMIAALFEAQIDGYAEGTVVYRFSARSMLGVIGLALLTVALAFGWSTRRDLRLAPLEADALPIARSDRVMRARSIGAIWPRWHLVRERGLMGMTLLLVVPVTACAIVAGHMRFYRHEARLGADFVISDRGIADVSTLDQSALDALETMAGIARVEYGYTNHSYRLASAMPAARDGRVLILLDDALTGETVYLDTVFAEDYAIGDMVSLVSMSTGRTLTMRVGGYREDVGEDILTFVCSPAHFRALTGIVSPPRTATVYLRDDISAGEIAAVRAFLEAHFAGFSDERAQALAEAEITARTGWVALVLVGAFGTTAAITLVALLCFAVEGRREEVALLRRLGTARGVVRRLFYVEMALRGLICALSGVGLGVLLIAALGGRIEPVGLAGSAATAVGLSMVLFLAPTQIAVGRFFCERDARR